MKNAVRCKSTKPQTITQSHRSGNKAISLHRHTEVANTFGTSLNHGDTTLHIGRSVDKDDSIAEIISEDDGPLPLPPEEQKSQVNVRSHSSSSLNEFISSQERAAQILTSSIGGKSFSPGGVSTRSTLRAAAAKKTNFGRGGRSPSNRIYKSYTNRSQNRKAI